MAGVQSSAGNELQYIYSIFRKLRLINESGNSYITVLESDLIPKKLLLKLIEQRLTNLDKLSDYLVRGLFERLTKTNKKEIDLKHLQENILWPEVDEYFHYSLYHLHDFVIDFDWYEPDIDTLTKSDENYIKSNLPQVQSFLFFKELLTKFDSDNKPASPVKTVSVPNLTVKSPNQKISKSLKSALVQGRADSPGRRRRVRFAETNEVSISLLSPPAGPVRDLNLKIEHSILALDLLIYSLNLFVQKICDYLAEWTTTTNGLKNSLKVIRESRKKLRTKQLSALSYEIKCFNDVFFSILDCLAVLRNIYLDNYVINTLCSRDPERLRNSYKAPRVRTFNRRIQLDVERKLISKLANQILQTLFDLIVAEINLPPIEFNIETKTKQRDEMENSRGNYLNFITSWFKADHVMFGSVSKSLSSISSKNQIHLEGENAVKTSTIATGGNFKSSSRILTQMDNLDELMRDMLHEIVGRIRSTMQLKFFSAILHSGLEYLFDLLSAQLLSQLDSAKDQDMQNRTEESLTADELLELSENINLVAVKIRCLKFVHIISSLDKMIMGLASVCGAQLGDELANKKLVQFTDHCMQRSRP